MAVEEKTWTILELIKWGTTYLTEKGFDEARLTTELLLSETLGVKRFDLYVKHDQPMQKSELEKFKLLLKRRLAHEPVQYILGKTNFYSIELKVDSRALIPRPETEILVEKVIEHCRTYLSQKDNISVLDIGTGSGCIAVAVAKFVRNAHVTAIDKSREALSLANENTRATGTSDRITLREMDFLALEQNDLGQSFDLMVSNPPYVASSEVAGLSEDISKYEPSAALTDGSDGLTFHRKIAQTAPRLLHSGGWIFVETGFQQAGQVESIFRNAGLVEMSITRDLANIERVVSGRYFSDGNLDGGSDSEATAQ